PNPVSIPNGCSERTSIVAVALWATRTRPVGTRLQYCLTSHSLESSSPSRRKTSTTQSRCYTSATFHFSNWAKSAATNCKFGSTNKPIAGELLRFTKSGGTRSVAQLNKTKAFRACESAKGAIESTPI